MASTPKGTSRGPAPRGIAQTERLALVGFGALTAFSGFVVLLLSGLPGWLRFGVGVPVTFVGISLCILAVRPAETIDQDDITPFTLLAIERLALFPLAVLSALGCGLVLFSSVALGPKLLVCLGSLLLALLFWGIILGNRLPDHTAVRLTPDRRHDNTED